MQGKGGFTLIELIISMTIGAIILLSVMSIFVSSSDISNKIDISRAMQENTKNIIEEIAEDIRKNGINICGRNGMITDCHDTSGSNNYVTGNILYVGGNQYNLATYNSPNYIIANIPLNCQNIASEKECVFVKEQDPLSNSFVAFTDLKFTITNTNIPKVTINFTLRPSTKKGVKPKMIEESELVFQTTITERIIKSN